MKTERKNNGIGKSALRSRNWNLMLVDDHGRIIPFKRFRGMALTIICLLIIAIGALAVSVFFHLYQLRRIDMLISELTTLRKQAADLRDEKDVLLAQLVTSGTLKVPETKSSQPAPEEPAEEKPAEEKQPQNRKSTAPVESAPDPEPVPGPQEPKQQSVQLEKVKWRADIRQFRADYQLNRSLVQAVFRIYNTSSPKRALSGHTVVVFKDSEKKPLQWISVPKAHLTDGIPDGKSGKRFRINNYMTMRLRAYDLKPPVVLDTASVYVFSEDTELIHSEDFDLDINVQPIAEPANDQEAKKTSDEEPARQPAQSNTPLEKQNSSPGEKEDQNPAEVEKENQLPQFAPADQLFLPNRNSGLPWTDSSTAGPNEARRDQDGQSSGSENGNDSSSEGGQQ